MAVSISFDLAIPGSPRKKACVLANMARRMISISSSRSRRLERIALRKSMAIFWLSVRDFVADILGCPLDFSYGFIDPSQIVIQKAFVRAFVITILNVASLIKSLVVREVEIFDFDYVADLSFRQFCCRHFHGSD